MAPKSTLQQLKDSFLDWELYKQAIPDLFKTGLPNTLILTVSASVIGLVLGMGLAVAGISSARWLRWPARVYTDVFRGLPEVVIILIIGLGVGPIVGGLTGNNPYPLGIAALGLMAAAYIGEILRSGIQSVEAGQLEASRALGFSYSSSMRLVVVPQGIRRVLPALVNQFISLLKASSLVYFLGLIASQRELFQVGRDLNAQTGNLSPLVAAGLFYLALTIPLTHLVNYIDARLRRGSRDDPPSRTIPLARPRPRRWSDAPPRNVRASLVGRQGHSPVVRHRTRCCAGSTSTCPRAPPTAVIGPSGSGKSTLLRALNRLYEPDRGDILLDGRSVLKDNPDELRQRIGMVFQQFNLFPHRPCSTTSRWRRASSRSSRADAARELGLAQLERVGLRHKADVRPATLSGGQQQRVAIARALAMAPQVMFFDEATSALDPELVKGILALIAELGADGMTMVVVTHEMGFARSAADAVVFMDHGKVVESGPPEQIFSDAETDRLRQFLSQVL